MHLPKGIRSHSPEEVTSELRPMWSTLAGERKRGRRAGSQALERGVCPGPWGHGGWGEVGMDGWQWGWGGCWKTQRRSSAVVGECAQLGWRAT